MTLVDDIPLTREGRRRRTARYLRVTGALLLLLSALPLAVNIDVLFVLAVFGGPILPLFCAYVLLSIARGRTSIVVYLRRFGRSSSNLAVAQALESGVSRRHRMVTLDDSRFVPLEVPKWERRVSRYGPPLLATAMILTFVVTVRALRQQGDVVFLWLSMGSVPIVAVSLWSVLTAYFLFLIHRRRIRHLARARITSEYDLAVRAASLMRLSSWSRVMGLAAPQATVLGVDDAVWQATVAVLVRDCSAVLIDLSEPTTNLAWELDTVLQQAGSKVVLIGDRTAVAAWRDAVGRQGKTSAPERISALVGDRTILAYNASDRRGRRRLRRSLLRALDNVALPASVEPSKRQRASGWSRLSASMRTFATYLLAPVLAAVLSAIAVTTVDPRVLGDLFVKREHPFDAVMPAEDVLGNHGVPITPAGLLDSVRKGKTEDMGRLLEAGVKPDASTQEGWTALHLAAAAGNIAALTTLLQAGASVNALTDDGRSALFLAAAGGHNAAIRTLAVAGAAVNVVVDRRTVLGLIIQLGDSELVRLLLDRGADVSAPHLGMSPVMLAAAMGRADILDALITRGAAIDVRSEYGHSPLDLATLADCRECTARLIASGAVVDARVSPVASSGSRNTPGSVPAHRRPHVNLALATTSDVQGLAVASALTGATAGSRPRAVFVPPERLEIQRQGLLPGIRRGGLDLRGTYLEFSTPERDISLCLPASDAHLRKGFMAGRCWADILLIVTSDGDDEARLEEHVKWARDAHVLNLLVVVTAASVPDSDEVLPATRAMLAKYGYEKASIVRLSLAPSGEDDESASPVDELLRDIDRIPPPVRAVDAPFLMVVEDVIPRGNKTGIVTGHVEAGIVRIGDEVEIVGSGVTGRTTVVAIESFRKLLDSAVEGDNVGIIMDNNMTAERGQIIAKPGSLRAHAQFDAAVYMLSPAEGGRLTPITDGYRPYLGVRTATVTAAFTFPQATGRVRPGETASAHIQLVGPVAMAPGLTFEIREAGRVVGCGIVTRVF